MADKAISQVDVTQCLAVYIDQHLTWKYHIKFVANKSSKSSGAISKSPSLGGDPGQGSGDFP